MGGKQPHRRSGQSRHAVSSSGQSSRRTPNIDPETREASLDTWLHAEFPVSEEPHSEASFMEHAMVQPSAMGSSSHHGNENIFDNDAEINRLLSEMATGSQPGEMQTSAAPGAANPSFEDMMQGLSVPQHYRGSAVGAQGSFEGQPSLQRNISAATSASSLVSEEKGTEREQEEEMLLKLKDEQNLPWKRISQAFKAEFNKDYSIPALQMRYRRLRQRRLLDFSEIDQAALLAAYEYWETKRWDIISEKMQEYGATDAWTPKACAEAWRRLQESRGRSDSQRAGPGGDDPGMLESEMVDVPEVTISRDPSSSNR